MSSFHLQLFLCCVFLLLIASCRSETTDLSQADFTLPDSGIEVADAWARPGRIDGVTAIYLNVLNGSAVTDTLLTLSSAAAGLVELHETFELANGMMGMREAQEPLFPARSAVSMQPGGLHIMLMQLNEALNEGDEVELILNFAIAGELTLTVPVRSAGNRP